MFSLFTPPVFSVCIHSKGLLRSCTTGFTPDDKRNGCHQCASISQCPLPITPCNLIPIAANDDEAEWDVTPEQGGGGMDGYMPQCITSQCVRPAGQRADDREGVG